KCIRLCAFQVENADELVAEEQRDDQLGTHRHLLRTAAAVADITRILSDVADAQGAALASGMAGDPGEERDPEAGRDGVLVMHGEGAFEKLPVLVPEHDCKELIVDELLDALRDAAEEFFAVENRSQLATHFVEQREALRLLGVRGELILWDGIRVAEEKTAEFRDVVHS